MSSEVKKTELVECSFYAVFSLKPPGRSKWMSPELKLLGTRSKKPTNLNSKQFAIKLRIAAPKHMLDDLVPEATIEVSDQKAITRNRLVAEALMADDAAPDIQF